jgi:protein ImuB
MSSRTIAIWCPDWPVTAARVAAGAPGDAPAAVFAAGRVVACDHPARAAGIRRGLRRREAQARYPDLLVLHRDEAVEARLFEPYVLALESIAPGVEITRPGLAAIGARGPSRYFGGETAVVHALSRALAGLGADVLIGIADGAFAAGQAARQALIVPPGESARFLADLPVDALDPFGTSGLVDLLGRLGLRTLGAFAALPARDVLDRFGPDGAWAHRQAGGHDDRPVAGRRPPAEFSVELRLEPPVERADTVTFSARESAERFVTGLAARGLACTCLELQVSSEHDEQVLRRWRHAGVLGTGDVLDRVRWQLEAWLSGPNRPSAGVSLLRLVPVETVPVGTHQQALWGGTGTGDERAQRALARVQTLLGHGSVRTAAVQGGRTPGQRTQLVPWGDAPEPVRSPAAPWPGRLPAPAPSVLIDPPRPIRVLDAAGHPVTVTERGAVPMPPTSLGLDGGNALAIEAWAGPWPYDERWWDAASAQRCARFQLVDARGRAYLVRCTLGRDASPGWALEGVYD